MAELFLVNYNSRGPGQGEKPEIEVPFSGEFLRYPKNNFFLFFSFSFNLSTSLLPFFLFPCLHFSFSFQHFFFLSLSVPHLKLDRIIWCLIKIFHTNLKSSENIFNTAISRPWKLESAKKVLTKALSRAALFSHNLI